jgi:hypothetical protein
MPDGYKSWDPLSAAQPRIPGVPKPAQPVQTVAPDPPAKPPARQAQSQQTYFWIGGGAAALILVIGVLWWMLGSQRPVQPVVAAETPATNVQPAPPPPKITLPDAPGVVATTEELSKTWSAQKFTYHYGSGDIAPAMVVRLPGDTFWAFSLREPYGTCEMEYITDLAKIRETFHYSASHPMVGDPCSGTLYDLMKYGGGPNGLVRGAVVAGSGIRPPIGIEVVVKGNEISATRSE